MHRVRFMLKYQQLLRENIDLLARTVSEEHGKTIIDSKGSIIRGIEVVEHCASFSS